MTATNLNIVTINRRMLSPSEAAQYCGLPVNKFPVICTVSPVELVVGKKLYDIHLLDRWLDALSITNLSDDDVIGRLE